MKRLPDYTTPVREEWIDYNGHLSEAYYVLVFGFATDQLMETLGMGEEYRSRTQNSLYTVEAHVRYIQEVSLGQEVTVRSRIIGSSEKKLHVAHEMYARVSHAERSDAHLGASEPSQSQVSEAKPEAVQVATSVHGHADSAGLGELVATEEILGLHVGGDPAGTVPFPEEVATGVTAATDDVAPSWVGRQIKPV